MDGGLQYGTVVDLPSRIYEVTTGERLPVNPTEQQSRSIAEKISQAPPGAVLEAAREHLQLAPGLDGAEHFLAGEMTRLAASLSSARGAVEHAAIARQAQLVSYLHAVFGTAVNAFRDRGDDGELAAELMELDVQVGQLASELAALKATIAKPEAKPEAEVGEEHAGGKPVKQSERK